MPQSLTTASVKPTKMGLYPTLNSLQSAIDLAYSQLRIEDRNQVLSVLMTYHNTLLSVLEQESKHV